ncbi:MAG: hypothetical protein GC181_05625 [Bacteroidetes bacterium]|nr:hypothetical protein [Bacteroidota bacterium]
MDAVNARLLKWMDAERIGKSEFAKTVNVSPSIMSHISSGRNKVGLDLVQKLCAHFPQLSIVWLLTGKGKMKNEDDGLTLEAVKQEAEILKQRLSDMESALNISKRTLKNLMDRLEQP